MSRGPVCRTLTVSLFTMVVVLTCLIAASCGSRQPIVIGGLISETGTAAAYGKVVRQGMELALEEVNAAGRMPQGRPLVIEYRDDGSAPERAKSLARDLIGKSHAAAIVGGITSGVALEVTPLCRDREVLLLSPSASSPELSSVGGGWFFRDYPSDLAEGQTMGQLALKLDLDKVAVLAFDDPFGKGIADIFGNQFEVEKNRKVVLREDFRSPISGDAAKALAKKVVESGAQGVYLAGYIDDVATLLQALQTASYKGVRMATSAVGPGILQLAGVAAERLVFPQPALDFEGGDPEVRQFVEAYKKKYNRFPDSPFAAYGYDAVKVLAAAIQKTKLATAGEIRGALSNIDYKGVSGPIQFDARGDVRREPHLYVIVKGDVMHFEGVDTGIRGILLP